MSEVGGLSAYGTGLLDTLPRLPGEPHSAAERIGAIDKNLKDGDMDIRAPDQQT
jgi:hypothetical protein